MIEAKGTNASVTFDGNFVTIKRNSLLGRMTIGKGDKRIPVGSISAVQWKPAGIMMNGFIEFSISGGNEAKSKLGSSTLDAAKNENAAVFTKKQMPDFERVRAEIEANIAHRQNGNSQIQSASIEDKLRQLLEMRKKGLITDQEYRAKRAQLLDLM